MHLYTFTYEIAIQSHDGYCSGEECDIDIYNVTIKVLYNKKPELNELKFFIEPHLNSELKKRSCFTSGSGYCEDSRDAPNWMPKHSRSNYEYKLLEHSSSEEYTESQNESLDSPIFHSINVNKIK